jgi:hypothetical protein
MKGKQGNLPPNVVRLRAARPGPASTAAILDGLKLTQIVVRIESKEDRKRVLDLAKRLADGDADAKT